MNVVCVVRFRALDAGISPNVDAGSADIMIDLPGGIWLTFAYISDPARAVPR